MPESNINVQLSIKEIYEAVCPECQLKIKELIKSKITDQTVTKIIGGT